MIRTKKSLQYFYDTLADSKEKGKEGSSTYTFSIYSHDPKDLTVDRLKIQGEENLWKPISSLSRKKRFGSFSLLRSPRGDKKSQDQFHFEIFREDWKMQDLNSKDQGENKKEKEALLDLSSKWKKDFYLS